ncbi:MAG: hypothetical protein KBS80_01080 [Bacteroidales bacterium]|nr:hypothetical protein [Candidatus Cryptobacteroides choladohippi]
MRILKLKYWNLPLVGIALTLCGVPLAMYLNQFVPSVPWTPAFMIMSVLLMVHWQNLFNLRFPSYNKWFLAIFLFQLIMIVYGILSENMTTQYLTFHLFIIADVFAMTTFPRSRSYDRLPFVVFLVSLPCVILGILVCQLQMVTGDIAYEMRKLNDSYAIEAFTVALGALTNMFSALCIINMKHARGKIWKVLSLFGLLGGFYVLLECSKRTPILVFVLGCLYFIYAFNRTSRKKRRKGLKVSKKFFFSSLAVICGLLVAYFAVPYVNDKVNTLAYNIYAGVMNMFGNTSVRDETGSAIERFDNRKAAYDIIESQFSMGNYLFGKGYLTRWIDNPLLESYLDMGLIGAFFYFILVVVFPLRVMFIRRCSLPQVLATMMCIYSMLSIMNSGNPYQITKYTGLCLVALVYGKCFRRKKGEKYIDIKQDISC